MKKRAMVIMFLAMSCIAVAGCATMKSAMHEYVRKGQILNVRDGQAYVCIGTADGAKAGQEYPVYRYVEVSSNVEEPSPIFKREKVGALKITEVVDVHYARATILSGDIKVHDVAELGR